MNSAVQDRHKPALNVAVAKTRSALSTSARDASLSAVWLNGSGNPAATSPRSVHVRVSIKSDMLPSDLVLEDGRLTLGGPALAPAIQAAQWLRDGLGLSMTQLAGLADVTRAAAYAWFKGTSPHLSKAKNLLAMRDALANCDASTLRFLPQVWDFPLPSGKTLLQILQGLSEPGGDASTVADALDHARPKVHELLNRSGKNTAANELGPAYSPDIYRDFGKTWDR